MVIVIAAVIVVALVIVIVKKLGRAEELLGEPPKTTKRYIRTVF